MVEALISYYSSGNKAQFAKRLDIKPQTINTWISRGTFDAELIYSKCEDVSGDWLLSGEGEMLRTSRHAVSYPAADKRMIESQQETIERLSRVIERLTLGEKKEEAARIA